MRIEPFSPPRASPSFPPSSTRHGSNSSTILEMCEGSYRRKHPIWKILTSFWNWILSFFYRSEKGKTFDYQRKIGEGGRLEYRLKHNGKLTDSSIKISPKTAAIEHLTIADSTRDREFRDMILEILRQENIDYLSVSNLEHAYRLWKTGLRTKVSVSFTPDKKSDWDQLVVEGIKKIYKADQLTCMQKQMLQSVDDSLVIGILGEYTQHEENQENVADYQIDFDAAADTLLWIQEILDHKFDLEGMHIRAKEGVEKSLEISLDNFITKIKDKEGRRKRDPITLSIRLNHLFAILHATKTAIPLSCRTKKLKHVEFGREG